MRHRVVKKKLASDNEHMKSLLNNLSTELILKEKVETTLAKAKALRPYIEKMVTFAGKAVKSGDKLKRFNAVKELSRSMHKETATRKLLEDIAERFANTPGGYTRIVKIGNRDGDQAKMARIEFINATNKKEKTAKKVKADTSVAESKSNE